MARAYLTVVVLVNLKKGISGPNYVILARACGVPAVVIRASLFGRSTTGNDVVATILISLFSALLRFPPLPDPVGHFGALWLPFWILQAVRRCSRCNVAAGAPFAARLVFFSFPETQLILAYHTLTGDQFFRIKSLDKCQMLPVYLV